MSREEARLHAALRELNKGKPVTAWRNDAPSVAVPPPKKSVPVTAKASDHKGSSPLIKRLL